MWKIFLYEAACRCIRKSLSIDGTRFHAPPIQILWMRSIFPEWKVSIADATAPHALEPKYPGLSESILSFGDFLDPLKIKPYGETIRLISQTTSKNYSQAIDCLAAAKSFLNDSHRIALSSLNPQKLNAYAKHFSYKNFPKKSGRGKEKVRFLSAINAEGIVSLDFLLSARFVRIFVLSLMIGVLHLPCFCPLSALMRWKTVRTSLPVTVRFHPIPKSIT